MSLTAEQLRLRDGKVTASFCPALMAGDSERILNEWRRLIGDPLYAEPDFADNWAVNFGSWVEPFALDWHQRKTGRALTRRGEVVNHPARPYVCCTLDAYRPDDAWVIDVKAIGGYRKLDEVCAYYLPQLVVQRGCTEGKGAALLIVHGGAEPMEYPADIPANYEREIWERIEWFYSCVESLTPPVALAPIAAPIPITKFREVDMTGSNLWSDMATTWLECHPAAKRFASTEKEIKAMIEPDVGKASGHGVVCKRDRAGRLSISAMK